MDDMVPDPGPDPGDLVRPLGPDPSDMSKKEEKDLGRYVDQVFQQILQQQVVEELMSMIREVLIREMTGLGVLEEGAY